MTAPDKVKNPAARRPGRAVLIWHRRVGLLAAVLVLALAVTGIVLNHGAALGLNRAYLDSSWLLDWYGMNPKTPPRAYRIGGKWLVRIENRLFFDGEMGVDGVARAPGRLQRVAAAPDGGLVVETDRGRFRTDSASGYNEWVEWRAGRGDPVWLAPRMPPAGVRNRVLVVFRGPGLSWDRLILDIHSGRILGAWGPYAMDLAALGLILLAATGFYNWLRGRR